MKGKRIFKAMAVICLSLIATSMTVLGGCSIVDKLIEAGSSTGTIWHSGNGDDMDLIVAHDGDFYFDEDDGKIYKLFVDEWKLVSTVKGEDGNVGVDGVDGRGVKSVTIEYEEIDGVLKAVLVFTFTDDTTNRVVTDIPNEEPIKTEALFKKAIESADNGANINLAGDIALNETNSFVIDKHVTLWLNGYTITAPEVSTVAEGEATALFNVVTGGSLTVYGDGNGEGSIVAVNDAISANGGNVIIHSGTFRSVKGKAILANGSSATINGGAFSSVNGTAISTVDGGSATINGGTFSSINGKAILAKGGSATINGGAFSSENGTAISTVDGGRVTINGGTFTNFPENNSDIIVNGGVFDTDPEYNLGEDKFVHENDDGTHTVKNLIKKTVAIEYTLGVKTLTMFKDTVIMFTNANHTPTAKVNSAGNVVVDLVEGYAYTATANGFNGDLIYDMTAPADTLTFSAPVERVSQDISICWTDSVEGEFKPLPKDLKVTFASEFQTVEDLITDADGKVTLVFNKNKLFDEEFTVTVDGKSYTATYTVGKDATTFEDKIVVVYSATQTFEFTATWKYVGYDYTANVPSGTSVKVAGNYETKYAEVGDNGKFSVTLLGNEFTSSDYTITFGEDYILRYNTEHSKDLVIEIGDKVTKTGISVSGQYTSNEEYKLLENGTSVTFSRNGVKYPAVQVNGGNVDFTYPTTPFDTTKFDVYVAGYVKVEEVDLTTVNAIQLTADKVSKDITFTFVWKYDGDTAFQNVPAGATVTFDGTYQDFKDVSIDGGKATIRFANSSIANEEFTVTVSYNGKTVECENYVLVASTTETVKTIEIVFKDTTEVNIPVSATLNGESYIIPNGTVVTFTRNGKDYYGTVNGGIINFKYPLSIFDTKEFTVSAPGCLGTTINLAETTTLALTALTATITYPDANVAYTITGADGNTAPKVVSYFTPVTFTVTPASDKVDDNGNTTVYSIDSVTANAGLTVENGVYTVSYVEGGITITVVASSVVYAPVSITYPSDSAYTITGIDGNGAPTSIKFGEEITYTVTPLSNVKITAIVMNGKEISVPVDTGISDAVSQTIQYNSSINEFNISEIKFIEYASGTITITNGKIIGATGIETFTTDLTTKSYQLLNDDNEISGTLTEDGVANVENVPFGTYTIKVVGGNYVGTIVIDSATVNATVAVDAVMFITDEASKGANISGLYTGDAIVYNKRSDETETKLTFNTDIYNNNIVYVEQVATITAPSVESMLIGVYVNAPSMEMAGALAYDPTQGFSIKFNQFNWAKASFAGTTSETTITVRVVTYIKNGEFTMNVYNVDTNELLSTLSRGTEFTHISKLCDKNWSSVKNGSAIIHSLKIKTELPTVDFDVQSNDLVNVTANPVKIGETATITVTPVADKNVKVNSITVDGGVLTPTYDNGVYTVTWTNNYIDSKTVNVVVDAEVIIPKSYTFDVTYLTYQDSILGKTPYAINGRTITFERNGEEVPAVVGEDGKVTVELYDYTYNVTLENSAKATFTPGVNESLNIVGKNFFEGVAQGTVAGTYKYNTKVFDNVLTVAQGANLAGTVVTFDYTFIPTGSSVSDGQGIKLFTAKNPTAKQRFNLYKNATDSSLCIKDVNLSNNNEGEKITGVTGNIIGAKVKLVISEDGKTLTITLTYNGQTITRPWSDGSCITTLQIGCAFGEGYTASYEMNNIMVSDVNALATLNLGETSDLYTVSADPADVKVGDTTTIKVTPKEDKNVTVTAIVVAGERLVPTLDNGVYTVTWTNNDATLKDIRVTVEASEKALQTYTVAVDYRTAQETTAYAINGRKVKFAGATNVEATIGEEVDGKVTVKLFAGTYTATLENGATLPFIATEYPADAEPLNFVGKAISAVNGSGMQDKDGDGVANDYTASTMNHTLLIAEGTNLAGTVVTFDYYLTNNTTDDQGQGIKLFTANKPYSAATANSDRYRFHLINRPGQFLCVRKDVSNAFQEQIAITSTVIEKAKVVVVVSEEGDELIITITLGGNKATYTWGGDDSPITRLEIGHPYGPNANVTWSMRNIMVSDIYAPAKVNLGEASDLYEVTADKTTVNKGEPVTFTITPKVENLTVNLVKLNGVVVIPNAEGKVTWTNDGVGSTGVTIEVNAIQEQPKEYTFNVTYRTAQEAAKGIEAYAYEGRKVTITGENISAIERTVTNGVIAVELLKGTYTAKIDNGAESVQFAVDGETLEGTLEFVGIETKKFQDTVTFNTNDTDGSYYVTGSKYDDTIVVAQGDNIGGTVVTFDYTLKITGTEGGQGIKIYTGGEKIRFSLYVTSSSKFTIQKKQPVNGSNIDSSDALYTFNDPKNIENAPTTVVISEDGMTIKITIVIKGKEISRSTTFAKPITSLEIGAAMGTGSCTFSMDNIIVSDINSPAKVNLPTTGEGYTVGADKTYVKQGDTTTITVTPNDGKVVDTIKVNGVDYVPTLEDGKYITTWTNYGDMVANVEVVTSAIAQEVQPYELKVMYRTAQETTSYPLYGRNVTFTGEGITRVAKADANGNVKVNLIPGTYTVSLGNGATLEGDTFTADGETLTDTLNFVGKAIELIKASDSSTPTYEDKDGDGVKDYFTSRTMGDALLIATGENLAGTVVTFKYSVNSNNNVGQGIRLYTVGQSYTTISKQHVRFNLLNEFNTKLYIKEQNEGQDAIAKGTALATYGAVVDANVKVEISEDGKTITITIDYKDQTIQRTWTDGSNITKLEIGCVCGVDGNLVSWSMANIMVSDVCAPNN